MSPVTSGVGCRVGTCELAVLKMRLRSSSLYSWYPSCNVNSSGRHDCGDSSSVSPGENDTPSPLFHDEKKDCVGSVVESMYGSAPSSQECVTGSWKEDPSP